MKALVTGASGHLGANLIRALIAAGWDVKALVHHDTRAIEGLDLEQVHGSILNKDSLIKAFRGVDCVFHLAARISVIRSDRTQVEEMNITGVRNVLHACMASGVKRLIHTSSFHAQVQEPFHETLDEARPLLGAGKHPPYNISKAEGERLVIDSVANGFDAVIVTPTGIIGPFDYHPSHFGSTLVKLAGRKLRILVDAELDWVDARDVARAMIRAAEISEPGEKYMLSGHRASLEEISGYIAGFMNQPPPRIFVPFTVACKCAPFVSAFDGILGRRRLFTPISMEELNSCREISHEKATAILGYEPRPLKDTVTDTLQWFIDNGYIIDTRGTPDE